jgi:hypothetical protein
VLSLKIDYHEKETFLLRPSKPIERVLLDRWLRRRQYHSEDDFYYLPRKDQCEPWQSSTILSLDVRSAGEAIYETREDLAEGSGTSWDELKIEYLLATLPREHIETLIEEVNALSTEFLLELRYCGEVISSTELAHCLNQIADQLVKQIDNTGSEALAILIEQQYGPP